MSSLLQLNLNLENQATINSLPGSDVSFGGFIGNILGIVLIFAVLLLFLYLIWGAISWMSAGGDNSKVQQARDRMTQAVIGLLILLVVVAAFNLLQAFFGISILNITPASPPPPPPAPGFVI